MQPLIQKVPVQRKKASVSGMKWGKNVKKQAISQARGEKAEMTASLHKFEICQFLYLLGIVSNAPPDGGAFEWGYYSSNSVISGTKPLLLPVSLIS